MKHPFHRHRHDPRTVEAVRRSLAEHAHDAPSGEHFAERVLAALDRAGDDPYAPPARPVRSRRRFAVPLGSAAAVLAVVGAVVLGVTQFGGGSDHDTVVGSPATRTPSSRSVTSSAPVQQAPQTTSPSSTPSPAGRTNHVVRYATLSNVKIQDVTFTGTDDGWALASADCLTSSGTCTALLRTTDGSTWQSRPNTPFNVSGVDHCASPCVTGLRFATDQIGYAFGPSALFMTTDGGGSWHRQPGGALGLETADGNVVRVTSSGSGCPGPCDIGIQTAPIGSSTWTTRHVGNTQNGAVAGAQLSRNGADVYLLVTGNPAGGASNATSSLFRSTDDGVTWTAAGEPCPQTGGEQDSVVVASGDGGGVGTLCQLRGTAQVRLASSSDAGARFTLSALVPVGGTQATHLASGAAGLWLAGGSTLVRTTDSGAHWSPVSDVTGTVSWIGFESGSVARVVTNGGSVIWTTRDGGLSWSRVRFG